jgi:hypothetical protein
LLPALARLRGRAGLEIFVLREGPDGEFRRMGDPHPIQYRPPEPDRPLLILGDLGCLGEPAERSAWHRFGRRLRRAGCNPVALMPCPPRFWEPRLAGLFFPVTWDRSHRLPRRASGPRPWPGHRAEPADDLDACRLLDLLAPAVRLEPALLRALRHALLIDVGGEAAAWIHPHVAPFPVALSWAGPSAVEKHRADYSKQSEPDRRRAGELIRYYHAHLPRSVRAEEAVNLAELEHNQPPPEAVNYMARTLRTMEQAEPGLRAGLIAWATRLGTRQHEAAWSADPRRAALWALAHREQLRSRTCKLPPGFEVAAVDWVLDGGSAPMPWTFRQQGMDLVLAPKSAQERASATGQAKDELLPDEAQLPGSPLATLELSDVPIQYTPLAAEASIERTVPAQPGSRIPLDESGLQLRSATAELTIASLPRPAWAEAIVRDSAGLYVDVMEAQGARRLRWVSPADSFSIQDGRDFATLRMPVGAFWDDCQYGELLGSGFTKPDWAKMIGIDDYGLWADVVYQDVTQRMRWIWPGEFFMGSPPKEPERYDNEVQHLVLLTRGYWLADTACTQALWQAVMGNNPSEFKGP